MLPRSSHSRIVHIATFPPRECGIATFTQDVINTCDKLYMPSQESVVVAMEREGLTHVYGDKVIGTITHDDRASYIKMADALNTDDSVSLVSIQHEFGIFGGQHGSHIVDFAQRLTKPLVVTMHTVLPRPEEMMRKIVIDLAERANRLIVMTETSKKILTETYGIDGAKVNVIPHGIHPSPYAVSTNAKKKLGFDSSIIFSTFGLLSSGKGIEYALNALPSVVEKYPNALYLVIGATHPVVVKQDGEVYRHFLEQEVRRLGLEKNVQFVNKYVSTSELLTYLQATDIYLSLSLNPDQAVSGTLSYALGAGRPVISTSFSQAKEFITEDVGKLVGFKDSVGIASAVESLLSRDDERLAMGKRAYFKTRRMTWPNVALAYMNTFMSVAPELRETQKNIPPISLDHFERMTDQYGMFQFAHLSEPDLQWGYTVDDNARALIAMVDLIEKVDDPELVVRATALARIYIAYMKEVQKKDGTFFNYVDHDHKSETVQNSMENLEEANARAINACARTAFSQKVADDIKETAEHIFERAKPLEKKFVAARALALHIKALTTWAGSAPDDIEYVKVCVRENADTLVQMYQNNATPEWHWFEDIIAYSNGIIPEALILAGQFLEDGHFSRIAREALDFLLVWSFEGDVCVPVGQNGWLKKGNKKHQFDQQPEEVSSLVRVCRKMYESTGESEYRSAALKAFHWFLGNNILGQIVYDMTTGGCYDGVSESAVNLNQGAESTVTYLLARLTVHDL